MPTVRTSRRALMVALLGMWVVGGCQGTNNHMTVVRASLPVASHDAVLQNQAGVQHLRKDRPALAEAAFKKSLAADEDYGPAHNNLGLLAYSRRDLPTAASEFQRAAQLLPDRAEPQNNLGLTLEAGGRMDDAIAAFQSAHHMAPENPEVLGNLIRARLKRGDSVAALREPLSQLLALDKRPDWLRWAEEQLALFANSEGDPAPVVTEKHETVPMPESIPTPLPTAISPELRIPNP